MVQVYHLSHRPVPCSKSAVPGRPNMRHAEILTGITVPNKCAGVREVTNHLLAPTYSGIPATSAPLHMFPLRPLVPHHPSVTYRHIYTYTHRMQHILLSNCQLLVNWQLLQVGWWTCGACAACPTSDSLCCLCLAQVGKWRGSHTNLEEFCGPFPSF